MHISHPTALVMSPTNMGESTSIGLPIWSGKSTNPMQWDNYRYAVQGFCASKGMSTLLKPEYVTPKDQEGNELQERFMGVLLQTTRDLAGMVVRPYADAGDGVGAWRALIARYGNDNKELRQAKQIEYVQKVFETRCAERDGILDTMHTLEHLFMEMDKLDCALPVSFKRNVVLLQLRSTAPEIYTALAMETNMNFERTLAEVKKLAALNSAVDDSKKGKENQATTFYSENKPKRGTPVKKTRKFKPNQCFWCLNFGHVVQDCPSRKRGEDPKLRPDGSKYKGQFEKGKPNPKSFQSFCFVSQAGQRPGGPWLIDSGCNKHMTPVKQDLSNCRPSNIVCTFGNKEELRAECCGEAEIETMTKKGDKVKIMLNDVLYIHGLPQRMFSTEKLCTFGGEFLQSERRQSMLVMPDAKTKIPLIKKGEFVWLTPHNCNNVNFPVDSTISSTAYAPGDSQSAQASLIDWHETLGHTHPASVLFLEQRGLIEVTGEKKLDNFNCRICKEAKSTVPHYQR